MPQSRFRRAIGGFAAVFATLICPPIALALKLIHALGLYLTSKIWTVNTSVDLFKLFIEKKGLIIDDISTQSKIDLSNIRDVKIYLNVKCDDQEIQTADGVFKGSPSLGEKGLSEALDDVRLTMLHQFAKKGLSTEGAQISIKWHCVIEDMDGKFAGASGEFIEGNGLSIHKQSTGFEDIRDCKEHSKFIADYMKRPKDSFQLYEGHIW